MQTIAELIGFLNRLEESNIYYELKKYRDSIMVIASVPGQRWEIEFMQDGGIEIEKFLSSGEICDGSEIEVLLKEFAE